MKELSVEQMKEINGGSLLSDQGAMCMTLAIFGVVAASNPVSAISYIVAGALIGCFG